MSKERGGSLIFLAVGIYGLVFSIGLPLGRWNEPGPGVFPLALSILLCVSGIFVVYPGKRKGGEKGERSVWEGLFENTRPLSRL